MADEEDDDEAKYYEGVQTEALLEFDSPTVEVLARIDAILNEMPIDSSSILRDDSDRVVVCGTRSEILIAITRFLRADHESNVQECEEWNGSFEYGVGYTNLRPDALEIWTRLIGPNPRQGSIYYQSPVWRLGPDQYLLWDNHTAD